MTAGRYFSNYFSSHVIQLRAFRETYIHLTAPYVLLIRCLDNVTLRYMYVLVYITKMVINVTYVDKKSFIIHNQRINY